MQRPDCSNCQHDNEDAEQFTLLYRRIVLLDIAVALGRRLKKVVQRGRIEVHDATNKERHACGRRRVGEPAVS